ncbi:MAG: branched-chain amino acid ABC transporter permease, partial [Rhodospirillaceae bacterium]|nr:branched-chain amino acid ABC transporter permease [Rhodospirillaceae bacterium]
MTVRAAGDPRAIPKTLKLYAFAGFMVIALIMPFVLDGYTTYRLAMALAMAMAILGVNLLTGLSGQFSIGHGAFFAIGAYTTAISMNHLGLSAYTA